MVELALEEGIEKGLAQGMEKGRKEIARKLLKLNLPVEQISEATGLKREEIEELK